MNYDRIRSIIEDFVAQDPGNKVPEGPAIFDSPLVGFIEATDPIFDDFGKPGIIGPHHRHPLEWLTSAQTVISYFLPISEDIRRSNVPGESASTQWLFARFWGEALNERLRRILVARLQDAGFDAMAPPFSDEYEVLDMNSNWSERHVAFAAGLGSFGLNRGLITVKGSAGRFGSVVTSLPVEDVGRHRPDPFEACPSVADGSCGKCVERCPAGAITVLGKDRSICSRYLREIQGPTVRSTMGFPYSPCGKCYVDVPCEAESPGTA